MDYAYLGQAFRWGPDQTNVLGWSVRKELIEIHKNSMRELEQRGRS